MRTLYRWTRDLHLYAGLAISPLVLVFAASVLVLNHPSSGPPQPVNAVVRQVEIPPGIEKLDGMARALAAHRILDQVGVAGEIGFVGYNAQRGIMTVPVARPGREAMVRISIPERRAIVQWSPWSAGGAVSWLHKMPGPHNANIRGNWYVTSVWRGMADALVYLVLFVSTTGVYLWFVLRAERRIGLVLLALGALSLAGMVYALL